MSLLKAIIGSGSSIRDRLKRLISLTVVDKYLAFDQAYTTPDGEARHGFNIGEHHVSQFGIAIPHSRKNFTNPPFDYTPILVDPDYSFSDKVIGSMTNGDTLCCVIMYGVSDDTVAAQYGHAPGEVYLSVHETRSYVAPANDVNNFTQTGIMPEVSLTSGKLFPYGNAINMPDGNTYIPGYTNVGTGIEETSDGTTFTVVSEPSSFYPIPSSVGETGMVLLAGTTNADSVLISCSRMNGAPNAVGLSQDGGVTWSYCGSLPDSTTGDRSPTAFTVGNYVYFVVVNRNDTQNTLRVFQFNKTTILNVAPQNIETLATDAFIKSWVKYESTCNTKAILSGIDVDHEASTDGSFANPTWSISNNGQILIGFSDLDGRQEPPYGGYDNVAVKGHILPFNTPLCSCINGIIPKSITASSGKIEVMHSLASPMDSNGIAAVFIGEDAEEIKRWVIPSGYRGLFGIGYMLRYDCSLTPTVHITIEKASANDPNTFIVLDTKTIVGLNGVETGTNRFIKTVLEAGDIVRICFENVGGGTLNLGGNDQLVGGQGYFTHLHIVQFAEGNTSLPSTDYITIGVNDFTLDTTPTTGNANNNEYKSIGLNTGLMYSLGGLIVEGDQIVLDDDIEDFYYIEFNMHISSITSGYENYNYAYLRISDPVDPVTETGRVKRYCKLTMEPDITGHKYTAMMCASLKGGERVDVVFLSLFPSTVLEIDGAVSITDKIGENSIYMERIPYNY